MHARTLALIVLVVGLTGAAFIASGRWRQAEPAARVAPSAPLADQCARVPSVAQRVVLRADDGVDLGAALVGSDDATVGVVVRHGASQRICEWLPWAGDIAAGGNVVVLLFDRRGTGSSSGEQDLTAEPGDVSTAVAWLHAQGITRVAVMGSSLGNAAMFSAIPNLDPAPCAVISVSATLVASGPGGTVDASDLAGLPDNVWLTWEQRNSTYAAQAQRVIDRQTADGRPAPHQLAVDTSDHSIGLVANHAEVRDFLADALDSCAR